MAERLQVVLFCEDISHETFTRAIIQRIAREVSVLEPELHVLSARGGHGRAITELKAWQRQVASGRPGAGDLLVVLIDANSEGWKNQQRAIKRVIHDQLFPQVIIACPDPHIEAWCAADARAFQDLFSCPVPEPPPGTGRNLYKQWLRSALEAAGEMVLSDPMEIAIDLVPAMDLFRAGKSSPSLGHLVEALQTALRGHARTARP